MAHLNIARKWGLNLVKECNKDCTYWQEGRGKCKILTYLDCPNYCVWKKTADERKASLKKSQDRLKKFKISTDPEEIALYERIMLKYYGKRARIMNIKPIPKDFNEKVNAEINNNKQ